MSSRTRRRLAELSGRPEAPNLRFHRPFGFFDYVSLQENAFCVLSDSGSVTEEAAILGFPAVTVREAHERPEGMDNAVVVMSGLDPERIAQAVEVVTAHHREGRRSPQIREYAGNDVARTIVRIVFSYVDYVHRTVWSAGRSGAPSMTVSPPTSTDAPAAATKVAGR